MPYVPQEDRDVVDPHINHCVDALSVMETTKAAGVFTYIVYVILKKVFSGKYWTRALGVGCLICAILEIYRREHGPYEDGAIKRNGDVK